MEKKKFGKTTPNLCFMDPAGFTNGQSNKFRKVIEELAWLLVNMQRFLN